MKSNGLLLLLALAVASSASADRIWLQSGKSMEGRFSRLDDGRVEIRTDFGSFRFSSEQVVKVERGQTFEQEILLALEGIGDSDVEAMYALAETCRLRQSFTLQKRILLAILAIDPDHIAARTDLGFHRFGNRWLTEEELHMARGEVFFRDEWMTPENRERRLAVEARMRETNKARDQFVIQEAVSRARMALMEAEMDRIRRRQEAREIERDEWSYPAYPWPYTTWPGTASPGHAAGSNAAPPEGYRNPTTPSLQRITSPPRRTTNPG